MTANEIAAIIAAQTQIEDNRESMPRDILATVRLIDGFATIVQGIRRCGKSTLTHQWRRGSEMKSIALNFDDLRMMTFAASDFQALDHVIEETAPAALFFDEIHIVDGWELYVRQKLDQGYKVMVTGSNASLLSRELGTRLTGRHLDVELTPFSYPEFLRFTSQAPEAESIADYIRRGGLPGYLRTGVIEVLQELVSDIMYKDVAVRHHMRDARPLRDLSFFLLGAAGQRVSPTRLKQAMRIKSATTILEYFGYLEEAYLVQRLESYSPSTKARLLSPKKIYIADTGLAWALRASQSPNWGSMLENVVYWHLRRKNAELFYFDDDDSECDFVARDQAGQWTAVQVAWELNPGNQKREFTGLSRAMTRLGISSGVIVTREQRDFASLEGRAVNVVPAFEYLCE